MRIDRNMMFLMNFKNKYQSQNSQQFIKQTIAGRKHQAQTQCEIEANYITYTNQYVKENIKL